MTTSIQKLKLNLIAAINILKPIVTSKDFLLGKYEENKGDEYIRDMEKAAYYATDQDAQDEEPGIQYWTNILEYNNKLLSTTDILMSLPADGREIIDDIESASSGMTQEISKKVKGLSLPSEFADVISENFYVFINELTFFEELHPFQRKLLDVYRKGGFPCGWRGGFPEGRLLVFFHLSDEHKVIP